MSKIVFHRTDTNEYYIPDKKKADDKHISVVIDKKSLEEIEKQVKKVISDSLKIK